MTAEADGLVNVEIKSTSGDPAALAEAVVDEVRAAGAAGRSAISSFDHDVVARVASREPGVATGALVAGALGRPAGELLRMLGADALHAPHVGLDLSEPGIPILVYTINDAGPFGLAARLARGGVTGLFTDDPASLAACFAVTPFAGRTRVRSGTAEHRSDVPPGGPTPPPSR